MKMQKSLLAALFVSTLAFTSVACDDDPAAPTDARMDRTPDTTSTTDGGLDRTPDTTVTEAGVDRTPDTTTTDATVDRAPDTTSDTPVDTTPADTSVDRTPDTTPDVAVDTAPDTTPDTTPDTAADVNPTGLNGCTTYQDRTAVGADRTITFLPALATDPERCMRVKVGQLVVFQTTDFVSHPLVASGGDTPTPITPETSGTAGGKLFNQQGVFGYRCNIHPSMTGAILVVP